LRDPKNKLDSKKFKIGIKCNGNPYFSQDQYRCIPIDELLAAIPKNNNVEIYYFDKEKTHPDTVNLKDKLETWEHTLDYIDQMDVIVSSCTSLVHAAGAMDKRTIVIVPLAEYYIWTSSRTNNTTPWYSDNVTVLKQSRVRSWQEPLAKMTKLVQDMINNYDKQL
jgi:ADP-heptose:LPS heptosyltransferase